jgi:hypothetical protein
VVKSTHGKLNIGGKIMKDNRANMKVNSWTRDRLMNLKYKLNKKSIDELLNEIIDEYWITRGDKNE